MTISPRLPAQGIVVLVVTLLSAWFYSSFDLSHDASWYLVATQKFAAGSELYSDLIEINPPLAFYLTVPAIWLAQFTTLSTTTAFFLYCSALGGISALWCASLITRANFEERRRLILFGSVLLIFFVLMIAEFGQREHLMAMLASPYLLSLVLMSRLQEIPRGEHIMLGLMAFLGLALKPYFLAIPAGIILARLLVTKDPRNLFLVSNWTLGLALTGYVAFIAIQHPLYLDYIVPIAQLVYDGYHITLWDVVLKLEVFLLIGFTFVMWRLREDIDHECIGAMGGAMGAALCYLIQHKGWNYQILPVSAWLILLMAFLATGPLRGQNSKPLVQRALMAISLILVGSQIMRGPYESSTAEDFSAFVEKKGQSIVVLSTSVSAAFPFVNKVEGDWASRYPATWFIPGAVNKLSRLDCGESSELCAEQNDVLELARSTMIEDFQRHRPELVYIDARARKPYFEVPFNYRKFLAQDTLFAVVWRCYRQIGTSRGYEVWSRVCTDSNDQSAVEMTQSSQ